MAIKNLVYALVAKLTPLKRDTWVFSSFNGNYSDSPRAISEELHKQEPSARIVWVAKPTADLPDYVERVAPNTLQAECAKRSANILIDNVWADMGFSSDSDNSKFAKKMKMMLRLRKKKGQRAYTTWHGLPLKQIGRDQIGNQYTTFLCNKLTMFVNSAYEEKIMRHVSFEKVNMIRLGMPRNDALFDAQRGLEIKNKLTISPDKKIILFAPTFRNDGKDVTGKNIQRSGLDQMNELNLDAMFQALSDKFGGEWVFICRFHYFVSSMVNWEELDRKYPGKFINGNVLPDMADYLACTDILITDASSCMFDFALTKKPCFIYFPDLENYQNKERGFYVPIESLPFPVSTSSDEFVRSIRNFDNSKYESEVNKMIDEFEFVDDGKAAERIIEYIKKDSQNA